MRILLVSTLKRNVAPNQYASRSRIIYEVGQGLVQKGHSVSLLGTEDSVIPGVSTIPVIPKGWVDMPPVENNFMREVATLIQLTKKIEEIQDNFDVIHNHTYPDFFPIVAGEKIHVPFVTTLHALAADYIDEMLPLFPNFQYVALSDAYRKLYNKATIEYVVYNGVDGSTYSYSSEKEDYLFWLGRLPKGKNTDGTFIDPKGVREALAGAQNAEKKLFLSGAVEDKAFFEKDVKPLLSSNIQWVGEVSSEQSVPTEKIVSLMQHAKAFIMSVRQDEPFGLVMAESMACGTPVIAFAKGSVPEVIEDGVTGFIVNASEEDKRGEWIIKKTGVDGLKEAIEKLYSLTPEEYAQMSRACRERVEKHFTIEKMVEGYEKVYQDILSKKQ